MMKRLDISDIQVLNIIESKFGISKANAVIDANEVAEKLINNIEYYQSHTYEEACSNAKKELRDEINSMDRKTALRNATMLAFKNKGILEVPEQEVQNIMDRLTNSVASNIIGNYKEITFKEQLSGKLHSVKLNYDAYAHMSDSDKFEYVALFQEMYLSEELFKAKITAIKDTASEQNLDVPLCLDNMSTIRKEGTRIIKKDELNSKDKGIITGIRTALKYTFNSPEDDDLSKNLKRALGFISAACTATASMNQKIDLPSILGKSAAVFALVMASLTVITNSYEIKSFFEDRFTLKEAEKLGLIDLLVNYEVSRNEFINFSKKVENINDGGPNGLQRK